MSEVLDWQSHALTDAEKSVVFPVIQGYAKREERNARRTRATGFAIGALGAALGALGLSAAVLMVYRQPKPPLPLYIIVDRSTGYVGDSVTAADAPDHFNDQVTEFWLRTYVEAREGYTYETDSVAYQRVSYMSDPNEQRHFAEDHNPPSSKAPAAVYGRDGYVRTENFHFTKHPGGKGRTFGYLVRFQKIEARGGKVSDPAWWQADVWFQWHPEYQMTTDIRQINPVGLQVISYNSSPE